MRKSIVSILLLLGAGVALAAVSQRVLVTRAASSAVSERSAAAIRVADTAPASTHAIADTVNAALLASKPMPGQLPELPQPEPSPSAWITPFGLNEFVNIEPLGQDVVVKALTLPPGQYTVLATLDVTTLLSGVCLLQGKADAAPFQTDLDRAAVGASEVPGFAPENEIQMSSRVALQGAVAFDGSGGTVRVTCRSFLDSAFGAPQMQARRPLLSAQLQRAIVLAPP